MNKIENTIDEQVYTYQTESGLQVIHVYRPLYTQGFAALGTPYGSINIEQRVNGIKVSYPQGSAHFLEHKVFEDEMGDILSQFSKLGANANAYTSYNETVYYFNHNDSILESLKLLLKFVRTLNISNESVEKEKGIIIEELKMYDQMPDTQLFETIKQSLFHTYPLKYNIGGTPESVTHTTKEDLENIHRYNYQDSKLLLVVVSDDDPEIIKDIVMENNTNKEHIYEVENVFEPEPLSVVRPYYEFESTTNRTKTILAYKFKCDDTYPLMTEYKISLLLEANLSRVNSQFQNWVDEKIISNDFFHSVDIQHNIGVIYFVNETEKVQEFVALINEYMEKLKINDDICMQLNRRNYGNMIFSMPEVGMKLMRYRLRGYDYFKFMKDIRDITAIDINNVKELLENTDKAIVVMKPMEIL